jgi:hypothetical protein
MTPGQALKRARQAVGLGQLQKLVMFSSTAASAPELPLVQIR